MLLVGIFTLNAFSQVSLEERPVYDANTASEQNGFSTEQKISLLCDQPSPESDIRVTRDLNSDVVLGWSRSNDRLVLNILIKHVIMFMEQWQLGLYANLSAVHTA